MAKNAIVSEELAKKFATEKDSPYTRWVRAEGLDIIGAHYVPSLHTVELKPWARRGGSGVFINHEASRTSNDGYVCEIPPAKKLEPQRQLFEEMILVLDGRGSTTVWNDAGNPHHQLRMEAAGRAVRGSRFQHLAPALQRLRPRARPLRRGHQRAAGGSTSTEDIDFVVPAPGTTSATASTASPITSSAKERAEGACCCRPTSSPTPSTCRWISCQGARRQLWRP